MINKRLARATFALTALTVLAGLVIQVSVSAGLDSAKFPSTAALVFNVFCYFTVQSNVIVGVTTALLAVRLERLSTVFWVFRLAGLVGIALTFVVFHLVLADLQHLEGAAAVADTLLHTVAPLLAVLGWLLWGPRGSTTWRVAVLAVLFPLCWSVFALVRGAIIDFYAYPFINVSELGYGRVAVNCVLIGALFFALSAAVVLADRQLPSLIGGQPVGRAGGPDLQASESADTLK